jgi:hypothetical protein
MSATFHLNGIGTDVIATGPATLATVVIGSPGSADSTVTLHDGPTTAGRVVSVVGGAAAVSLQFGVALLSGLTAVIAGTTSPDLTIVLD